MQLQSVHGAVANRDNGFDDLKALLDGRGQLITTGQLTFLNGMKAATANASVYSLLEEIGEAIEFGCYTTFEGLSCATVLDDSHQLGFKAFPRPKKRQSPLTMLQRGHGLNLRTGPWCSWAVVSPRQMGYTQYN